MISKKKVKMTKKKRTMMDKEEKMEIKRDKLRKGKTLEKMEIRILNRPRSERRIQKD